MNKEGSTLIALMWCYEHFFSFLPFPILTCTWPSSWTLFASQIQRNYFRILWSHPPRFTSHCKYANGRGILLTCAVDTDHKKASRQPHLPASMLNSSLVLSAITCKAEGMHSPYVTLGRMQSAPNFGEGVSEWTWGSLCALTFHILPYTFVFHVYMCTQSVFPLSLITLGRRIKGPQKTIGPFITMHCICWCQTTVVYAYSYAKCVFIWWPITCV